MGASRSIIGFVAVSLFVAGCATGSDEGLDPEDYDVDLEAASFPAAAAPPGSSCALIQRGTFGQVQDTDIALGNGANYAMGWYPQIKTGLSTTEHWGVYHFDLTGVVPAGKVVNYASLTLHVGWNTNMNVVRAHRVLLPWNEVTATYNNFGGTAAWSPAVAGSFLANDTGYKTVELTSLVQAWHSGTWSNYGVLLEEDVTNSHQFYASEGGTVAKRPGLWVCWADAPPPACGDQGAVCETAADCCDELPCVSAVCGGSPPVCGDQGAVCETAADCCDGLPCVSAVCGGSPPVCAGPGEACGAGASCCSGLCNEGVCPGGGGGSGGGDPGGSCANPGEACGAGASCCVGLCNEGVCPGGSGGGGECSATGSLCSFDSQCCSGSCWDGACVDAAACVGIDTGFACSPWNPCCDGGTCIGDIGGGMCIPGEYLTCVPPGAECDPFMDACCWAGKACLPADGGGYACQ